MPRVRRFPLLTSVSLLLTAAFTSTRLAGAGVVHALWRDPAGLTHGQVWRLFTPVLVQTDPTWTVVKVLVVCAVVGAIGEQVFSRARWFGLYLIGALAGHAIGEIFQPHQGGTSVAFAGILGGLAAQALLRGEQVKPVLRVQAGLAIALAILDTALGDIHGLPFLAGLALASVWLVRAGRVGVRAGAGEARPAWVGWSVRAERRQRCTRCSFTLWDGEPPAEVAGTRYAVLHLSRPGTDDLRVGRQW